MGRAAQPRVRRAQVAVGAARQFGQAVEHRVAGELARGWIFDVQEVFAVRLAVADDQARAAERDDWQAVQAMARLVETFIQGVEFVVDVVLGMLYVYGRLLTHFGPRRTLLFTSLISIGGIAGGYGLIIEGQNWARGALYIHREAYVILLVEQYWSFLNSTLKKEHVLSVYALSISALEKRLSK